MRNESPYEQYLKEKLEYDSLVTQYKYHVQMLDEIIDIIADTLSSNRKKICISREEKTAEFIKSQFTKLEKRHIQLFMDSMLANTTKIKNIRQYLLTALYNVMQTNGNFKKERYG